MSCHLGRSFRMRDRTQLAILRMDMLLVLALDLGMDREITIIIEKYIF
jgi:hypothetical protein